MATSKVNDTKLDRIVILEKQYAMSSVESDFFSIIHTKHDTFITNLRVSSSLLMLN